MGASWPQLCRRKTFKTSYGSIALRLKLPGGRLKGHVHAARSQSQLPQCGSALTCRAQFHAHTLRRAVVGAASAAVFDLRKAAEAAPTKKMPRRASRRKPWVFLTVALVDG